MVNRAALIAATFLSVAVARPATRHGTDLGIVVEFSDAGLYGALGGVVCSSWLNHFPRALVYSDTLSQFPVGSSAARECSAQIELVALVDVLPLAMNLNATIGSAQYKREFVLIDVARRWRAAPPRWVVSTEMDTWWSVDLLDWYIDALDTRLEEWSEESSPSRPSQSSGHVSSRDSDSGVAAVGSTTGPMSHGGSHAVSRAVSRAASTAARLSILAGAGPWGPFLVFTWPYIKRFVELRLPCRSSHLRCMCPSESVSRVLDDPAFLTDPVDPRDCTDGCLMTHTSRGGGSSLLDDCQDICYRRQNQRGTYSAALYNNDHLVACTLKDAAIVDWSVLCPETNHVCPDATGRFVFWYNSDFSSDSGRRAPLEILRDWPHRAVAMHHVNASQMGELSDVEEAMPSDPYAERHWPTLFVLGVQKSATSTTFNAIQTSQSWCRPTLFEGDPSYYNKEMQYLESPDGTFLAERYLRRFVVNRSSDNVCDRFVDATPNNLPLQRAAQRLMRNMPRAVRDAAQFVVVLREVC